MSITINELIEFFVDTLQKCGMYLLEKNDEYIGYCIFEEFDSGATSFLHDDTLLRLKTANLINENVSQKCSELRSKFMKLQNTDHWNVDSVKFTKEWREILELSDEIKSLMAI